MSASSFIISTAVTETWDVFKQTSLFRALTEFLTVTETWDVFKQTNQYARLILCFPVTETWDVFKRLHYA